MTKKCVVCKLEPNPNCTLTFHKFPKNDILKQKWISALQLTKNVNSNTTYVCSNHFLESDFFHTSENRQRTRLLTDAVPSYNKNSTPGHSLHASTSTLVLHEPKQQNLVVLNDEVSGSSTVESRENDLSSPTTLYHNADQTENKVSVPTNHYDDDIRNNRKRKLENTDTQPRKRVRLTDGARTELFSRKDFSSEKSWSRFVEVIESKQRKQAAIRQKNSRNNKKLCSLKGMVKSLEESNELYAAQYLQVQDINDDTTCSLKRQGDSEISEVSPQPKQKREDVISKQPHPINVVWIKDCEASNTSPKENKMEEVKGRLRFCEEKIKKQTVHIKKLQRQNRMLEKINSLDKLLLRLEEEFLIPREHLDCLKYTDVKDQELFTHENTVESGVVSSGKFSPELRCFAVTLFYYSPKAYDYVRKTFHTCLPNTHVLKTWFLKIGGEPGFTNESFAALKQKAELSNQPLLANLVLDEMSIRRYVGFFGGKCRGYIDVGSEIDGDILEEAKEALVFLVTAINSDFKVPVGYFLVDIVSGEQRAGLLKLCLELLHEAGVRVVAVTFDGYMPNMSMAKLLGCSFEKQNVQFQHPVTTDPIVAILNPSHMLTLIRNTFHMHGILVDKNGNKIQWKHLDELKSQCDENKSNKSLDHIDFKNERIKVKLETQIISASVAEAVKSCRQSGMSSFQDSEPTENFLRICGTLSELFNSKKLNANNSDHVFEFLRKAYDYIQKLKIQNGTHLIKSEKKVGFLGFLSCMKAVEHLYSDLIKTKILLELPFDRFRRHHIEIFFNNIRAEGVAKNDPTAGQFISAYKKILNKDNRVVLEHISILNCSSAVERINSFNPWSCSDPIEEETEELGFDSSEYSNQALERIAGYIVRTFFKQIYCDVCVGALVTHHSQSFHKVIIARVQDCLLFPSRDVVKICQTVETSLKNVDVRVMRKEVLILQIMRKFIGTSLFDDITSHQLGEFPVSNHITDLLVAIVEKYIDVRVPHLLKMRISKPQFFEMYPSRRWSL